jgi:hypothetical protein
LTLLIIQRNIVLLESAEKEVQDKS